jgi:hypothetical protein
MNLSKATMEASNGGPVHVMRRSRTRSAYCKRRLAKTEQNYPSLGMAVHLMTQMLMLIN